LTKNKILNEKFGYHSFRSGQEETIDAILSGKDVLAVMPTGAGKSLCYQIPALLLEGMTIVISPLISLMKDQVTALHETGCEAAYLNSSLTNEEYAGTMKNILDGKIKLLYIAPERLQKTEISNLIQTQYASDIKLPLIVIDEAHCVSQWGHDFRTSYLQIANFINNVKERPVVAAFTATATVKVRDDIRRLLALRDPFVINTGFDRPNLYFEVQKPKEKKLALLECLEKRKNLSGIIYCATRKAVEEICDLLVYNGYDATRYHAGLDDSERKKNQEDFIYDRKTIMIATNAFGMGIDKSNVSFVIHYNMPKNIESYYQEAGRAGRDGENADCILLYNGQDVRINQYLISQGEEGERVNEDLIRYNLELLKQITFYASCGDCLRRRLLSYFGETINKACGNCSNCLTSFKKIDVTTEAQKIVSCVYRLKQRERCFGKTMIIDILRGSKNEKIKRFGLDTLSTWGLLSETSAHRLRLIMDFVIDEGYLNMEEGEFPVVTLGNWNELFKEDTQVFMKLPEEKKPSPKMKELHTELHTELRKELRTEIRTDHTQNMFSNTSENVYDETLFEKLRKLRKEIAVKESVPAYIVFSDASLKDMSRKKPVSLAQFSSVNGVGNVKLEKYGEEFTSLIRKYTENDNQ